MSVIPPECREAAKSAVFLTGMAICAAYTAVSLSMFAAMTWKMVGYRTKCHELVRAGRDAMNELRA